MLRFALISDTPSVTGGALRKLAPALEANARHCWEAWHEYLPPWVQDIPPSVVPWDDNGIRGLSPRSLPPWDSKTGHDHLVPLYFVDDNSRDPGTLAVHYVQGDRPAGRVYVQSASGLNTGRTSVSEAASHEIVEVIANPWLLEWLPMPGRPGLWAPRENADPVQDHYLVRSHGVDWPVSNFVTPAWFGLPMPHDSVAAPRVDHLGTLSAPGEIGPEGYVVLRDREWRIRYEFGARRDGFSSREANSKAHPLCRTRRIREAAETRARH